MQRETTIRKQNLALVRRFCEARINKDSKEIMDCLADDAVWRYPGCNPLSREYRGKEEVASFFKKLRELTGKNFTTEPERILVDDANAIVHELQCGTIEGKSLEWDSVLLLHLCEGKISEGKVFQHIQYELDEWWNL